MLSSSRRCHQWDGQNPWRWKEEGISWCWSQAEPVGLREGSQGISWSVKLHQCTDFGTGAPHSHEELSWDCFQGQDLSFEVWSMWHIVHMVGKFMFLTVIQKNGVPLLEQRVGGCRKRVPGTLLLILSPWQTPKWGNRLCVYCLSLCSHVLSLSTQFTQYWFIYRTEEALRR